MIRSDIHADGTVYAYQPRVGYAVPARVVETGRFWTKYRPYVGKTVITMNYASTPSRSSDPVTVRRYNGFLIVAATKDRRDDPETLALLTSLELKAPEDSEDMEGWRSLLPEGLEVHIVVSRDLLDPWALHVVERDRKRVEEQRAQEQRSRNYHRAHKAHADALEVMERFGLTENHAPAPGHTTVRVDAEQLTALLRRFEAEASGL